MFSSITRRKLEIALGIFWLVDAILQFQPKMFTPTFVHSVITPVGVGQPHVVSALVNFGGRIILLHPALIDFAFGLIQLAIGLLILYKKSVKYGLIISIIWGTGVWIFGEGLGGIASGHTLLMMGAPGAVLIYVVLAISLLPSSSEKNSRSPMPSWLNFIWLIFWLGGSVLQLVNGQNTTSDLAVMIRQGSLSAPGWLQSINLHVANFFQSKNGWLIIGLVVMQALIGFLVVLSKNLRLLAIITGSLLMILFWFIGENLGGFYTGLATDPNSALLFILLGIAILGSKPVDLKLT